MASYVNSHVNKCDTSSSHVNLSENDALGCAVSVERALAEIGVIAPHPAVTPPMNRPVVPAPGQPMFSNASWMPAFAGDEPNF